MTQITILFGNRFLNLSQMHIIYLIKSANYVSGGTRVIFEHANRLQKRHHQVEIWTDEPLVQPGFPSKVPIYCIYDIKFQPIDILVATDPFFLLGNLWGKIKAHKYFLFLQHDSELILRSVGYHNAADQLRNSFLHEFPKKVQIIALSHWIQKRLFQEYSLRSTVVLSGINTQLFHQAKPLLKDQKQRVMFFYDFQLWKGGDEMAKAIDLLKKTDPNLGIIMVGGTWPSLPKDSSPLSGYSFHWPVVFFNNPPQDELARIYSSASVFISPSWFEGFGLPGLEAMACGVPVVTTDSGGIREYAIPGKTAIVVPPKNPEALAKGVLRVLRNKKLRSRLIKNGLKKAKEFDWDDEIDKLEEIFGTW